MTRLIEVDLDPAIPCPDVTFDPREVPTEIPLNRGRPQLHQWKNITVELADDEEGPPGLVDYIFTVPFKMASRRLVEVLQNFKCECEYLPLTVHYQGRRLESEYFALNALRIVDEAIDLNQSTIGFYDDEYRHAEDVQHLALRENAVGDAPLSFLSEIGRFAVSDELARAICDANLIGIKLVTPEEFGS